MARCFNISVLEILNLVFLPTEIKLDFVMPVLIMKVGQNGMWQIGSKQPSSCHSYLVSILYLAKLVLRSVKDMLYHLSMLSKVHAPVRVSYPPYLESRYAKQ